MQKHFCLFHTNAKLKIDMDMKYLEVYSVTNLFRDLKALYRDMQQKQKLYIWKNRFEYSLRLIKHHIALRHIFDYLEM